MTVLKAQDLGTAEELLELIGSLVPPESDPLWLWAAAVDGWCFDFWPGLTGDALCHAAHRLPRQTPVSNLLPRAEDGRLFSPNGELRWRRISHGDRTVWRTIYLGQSDWIGDRLSSRSELNDLQLESHRTSYFLWGQRTGPGDGTGIAEWIELSIPHRFRWPLQEDQPPGTRVMLEVEQWTDPAGQMHFQRFCRVHPEALDAEPATASSDSTAHD